MIKKKMQVGGKVKTATKLKGRPMGGKIGEFQDMIDKAKRGDRQAEADLKLERAKLKTFGEGPGSGPSGAMPKPKKKMGGVVKKAKSGFDLNKDGKTTFKDVLIGRGVLPKTAKKGASVKKCKYGCK